MYINMIISYTYELYIIFSHNSSIRHIYIILHIHMDIIIYPLTLFSNLMDICVIIHIII